MLDALIEACDITASGKGDEKSRPTDFQILSFVTGLLDFFFVTSLL